MATAATLLIQEPFLRRTTHLHQRTTLPIRHASFAQFKIRRNFTGLRFKCFFSDGTNSIHPAASLLRRDGEPKLGFSLKNDRNPIEDLAKELLMNAIKALQKAAAAALLAGLLLFMFHHHPLAALAASGGRIGGRASSSSSRSCGGGGRGRSCGGGGRGRRSSSSSRRRSRPSSSGSAVCYESDCDFDTDEVDLWRLFLGMDRADLWQLFVGSTMCTLCCMSVLGSREQMTATGTSILKLQVWLNLWIRHAQV